ncbi:MAG: hypothetical protein WEB53_07135 [Akkermansiaceae bacterium]
MNSIVGRIQLVRAAWGELAPDATFAGMTFAEFEEASVAPLSLRTAILAMEKQLEGQKTERSKADLAAAEVLDLVVNSVKGTPGYGRDSALYRACGYVRKSERKSGLTRKGSATLPDANVA